MANFGSFCLLFALCLSVYALCAALLEASQKRGRFLRSAERAVYAATGSVTLAFLSLLYLHAGKRFFRVASRRHHQPRIPGLL